MKQPHDSAITHVTGKSEYIDDRAFTQGEVQVGVLFSPHAKAMIKKISTDKALKIPGVLAVYTAKDFLHNVWGTIFQDQPLLADKEVNYVGEGVAIVAAENKAAMIAGLKAVEVLYQVKPAILTVAEAKKQKSFIGIERHVQRGDVKAALGNAPHQLKGHLHLQGADHFYLESQAVIAYPKEDGQIEVHSSTQHPTEVQHVVSHALNISSKDVVCIVKRMGGAFGGKESQAAPFAAYAALVADRLKKPARLILSKDDDMIMTGKRNPFEIDYHVGFDKNGLITALDIQLFSDGGAFADLSTAIMERAILHCDNAYYIPNIKVLGQVCRTNFHPHTAFRGFGGPKGVAVIEYIMEEIAHHLKKDALSIRQLNCYAVDGERSFTPYDQKVENNCLPALFSELEKKCDYQKRRQEIELENKSNPKELRGLSMTAVKFGISFNTRFLNQANALVNVYRDGTIQVSTGATEMGQGVNARIAKLVADELGLPSTQARVMPTSTEKNANTSPTAASSGTDLNGSAAVLAVRKIKGRLSELAAKLLTTPQNQWAKHTAAIGTANEIEVNDHPYTKMIPNEAVDWTSGTFSFNDIVFTEGSVFHAKDPKNKISFLDLVNEAYLNRISLCDYAYYRTPHLAFDKTTGKGRAFLYFSQGTAASEVKINRLTGEVKVVRTDILMDLGRPVIEGLDMGQVYGGFIQGMGWMTTENLFYNADGLLLSHSPSTYKIPSIQDIPRTFNVEFFENDNNHSNLRGTKASGEPPLLLSISVWTAIHDALKSLPHFAKEFPRLQIPATQEAVLRAICPDKFARYSQ